MTIQRTVASALAIFLAVQTTSVMAQTNLELRDELLGLVGSSESGHILIQEASRRHGPDSPEVQALLEEQNRMEVRNLTRLRGIISEYGWPGQSMVGRDGAADAFLILQHADHEAQVEYLPLVKTALEAGELERRHFALLQDQILVAERRPQIFGTQLYWDDITDKLEPFPIEDEANVDSRREAFGLEPLAEYVERVRGYNSREGGP